MPDNTIDWGQGSANNDIGWGKGPINNDLSWGMIGEDSYGHDETNLMGGGADPLLFIWGSATEKNWGQATAENWG